MQKCTEESKATVLLFSCDPVLIDRSVCLADFDDDAVVFHAPWEVRQHLENSYQVHVAFKRYPVES